MVNHDKTKPIYKDIVQVDLLGCDSWSAFSDESDVPIDSISWPIINTHSWMSVDDKTAIIF